MSEQVETLKTALKALSLREPFGVYTNSLDWLLEVEKAARKLVDRMSEIQDGPEYQEVWTLAHVHGQSYRGRAWKAEFEQLRSILETNR